MFVIEDGTGLANSTAYACYEWLMEYTDIRIGFEHISGENGFQIDKNKAEKYLVAASDMLDTLNWTGRKSNPYQSMQWPRKYAQNKCDDCCECYPCDVVPKEIVEATIILASLLIKGDISFMTQESSPLVKSMSFEGQRIEFTTGGRISGNSGDGCNGGLSTVSGDKFKNVRHLINCFLKPKGSQLRFKRG